MVPVAMAAAFARHIECRGILVIYFSVFKTYYVLFSSLTLCVCGITSCLVRLHCVSISVTSHGSDKPVCHGGATALNGYPRSITIISLFY